MTTANETIIGKFYRDLSGWLWRRVSRQVGDDYYFTLYDCLVGQCEILQNEYSFNGCVEMEEEEAYRERKRV